MSYNPEWNIKRFETLTPDIADQVSTFRQKFTVDESRHIRTTAPGYYLWKLRDNPYGQGCLAVAYNDHKQIVSTYTCTWRRFYYKGSWYYSINMGDAFTLPEYQRLGISSTLFKCNRNWAMSQGADLIYNTPNEMSRRVSSKFNMIHHPHINHYFWLLPLKSTFLWKKYNLPYLQKSLDTCIRSVISFLSLRQSPRLTISNPVFDEEFDELNSALGNTFFFHFDKSKAYLNYRYVRNPDHRKYQVIAFRNPELRAVLICKSTVQWGLNVLSVVDWYGIDSISMRRVWLHFVRMACEKQYDMIANWVPRRIPFIKAMAPVFAVPYKPKAFCIYYDHGLGKELLKEKGTMLFSASEADFI